MNTTETGEPLGEAPEIVTTKCQPLQPVTLYQARCTTCGKVEDEYGDYSCVDDPIEYVLDYGWFERTRTEPTPTLDNPHRKIVHTVELLCPDCFRCEVCGHSQAYAIDEHLVCADHEDHDFGDAA